MDLRSNTGRLSRAPEVPDYLLPIRRRAAARAGMAEEELEEALVTEYPPGAPINRHRDLPMFETIIGISLLGSCIMKLRRLQKDAKPVSIFLKPSSLYIMQGAVRWNYQHSIPPVKEHRYSITFRSLRHQRGGS